MNWIKSAWNKLVGKASPIPVEAANHLLTFDAETQKKSPILPVDRISTREAIAAYTFSPEIYTAVNLIAYMISGVPLKIYWYKTNGSKQELFRGQTVDLLNNPNPRCTKSQLIFNAVAWRELAGRSFIAYDSIDGQNYLFILNPRYTYPIIDKDTGLDGFVYKNGDVEIYYAKEDVIVWEKWNPNDDFYGASTVQPLADDIQARRAALKTSKSHSQKGGLSGGILTVPMNFDSGKKEQIRKNWDKRTTDSSRLVILEQDWKFDELKFETSDKFTTDSLNASREAVSNAYGIPVALLNPDKNSHPEEAEMFFWTSRLFPTLQQLEELLTLKLSTFVNDPKRGRIGIEFYRNAVPVMQTARLNAMRTYIAALTTGAMTFNEYREEQDIDVYPSTFDGSFGNTPYPVFNANQTAQAAASPSLTLPGDSGRDQSATGEAQMVDTTGQR